MLRLILRAFFRLLYHELAFTYDLVSVLVSAGQWRAWQRAALPYLRPAGRVLEVAHGTGNLLLDLSARGYAAAGVDFSPAMGRLARGRLRGRGLAAPLARGRVQALPFASGAFASVLSTFPTEFVVDPAAVAEFYRVLAPGGVFVCVPVARITGRALPDRLAGWLFAVTGQSSEGWFAPLVERYAAAGFAARVEQVRQARALVTVVVAEKSA